MREAVTLVADWLADSVMGVGALLPGVPRASGDALPVLGAIRSEYVDELAAHRRLEQNGTLEVAVLSAAVRHDEGTPVGSGSQRRLGDVDVVIRVDYKDADGPAATRGAEYACVAVERCLRRARLLPEMDRTLDGVVLMFPTSMERGRGDAPTEDSQVTAGVLVTWRFADLSAEGQ